MVFHADVLLMGQTNILCRRVWATAQGCGLCGSKGDGTAGEGGAAVGGGSSSLVEKADAKVPSDGSEAAKGHEEPGVLLLVHHRATHHDF